MRGQSFFCQPKKLMTSFLIYIAVLMSCHTCLFRQLSTSSIKYSLMVTHTYIVKIVLRLIFWAITVTLYLGKLPICNHWNLQLLRYYSCLIGLLLMERNVEQQSWKILSTMRIQLTIWNSRYSTFLHFQNQ